MTAPILSVNNIRFVRNGRPILNGIDWTVAPGEHWAILGANGSGKTTLLKILTGYEWVTDGRVEVLGRCFGQTDVRELRKIIGLVSSSIEHRIPTEDTAMDVVLSGLDAALGTYRRYAQEEHRTATAALESIGAAAYADRRYGLLSQGEQQRVLIARALIARPALLILDEPCAGLDPAARHHFLKDMQSLADGPLAATLVLVTHHIEEIGPWITRVLVLQDGNVLAAGTPAATLTDAIMSRAFGAPCRVTGDRSGFRLEMV